MLYIVATPIGNLSEITYRAVEVLKNVDFIAAEDTRHTMELLRAYDIRKPMISYHKFSERSASAGIISRLKEGKDIALVSDAGMPLISDPGAVLVEELIENGIEYTVVSGACACVNAVVLSGLDTSSFLMVGFLPEKTSDRKKTIAKIKDVEATLVFYSPPHNVLEDLDFLHKSLGRRKFAVVREISKLHEEVVRGCLGEVPEFTVKGEMVIVVEKAESAADRLGELTVIEHVKHYMSLGYDKMKAVKLVAADRKVSKSVVYAETLNL